MIELIQNCPDPLRDICNFSEVITLSAWRQVHVNLEVLCMVYQLLAPNHFCMKSFLAFILSLAAISMFAQKKETLNYGSITGAIGDSQGSASIEYFHNWKLGKSAKILIGLGGRFTSYFGADQFYSSAPASLANDESKVDSLLLASANVNAVNIAIHLGYQLSPKINVGFDIDALGFSFGSKQDGFYLSNNQGQGTSAKPTAFNALLVGNNDRGTLNSELYARYFFNERLGIKVAYQYLFTEYTTDTEVQQSPESNDRFRNKASLFSIGITRTF